MFQITSQIYNFIAVELQNIISPTTIFSNTIKFEYDEIEIYFIATIIPYYRLEHFPEGITEVLYDIVPVWCELHTSTIDGEVPNDFDFDTLKFITCQQ
ncbi:MAG: hypothetical protein SNH55_00265 [Rikenellaceae bacterium]